MSGSFGWVQDGPAAAAGGSGRVLSASEPVSREPGSPAASFRGGWVHDGPWAARGGVQDGAASVATGGWFRVLSEA
jgi:hypothetical protein